MIQLVRLAVVLVLCSWAVSFAKRTPTVVPASAPRTEFSAERAWTHVRRIAMRPHPTGSEANDAVLAYITGEIRKQGLSPDVQSTTAVGTRYPTVGHVRNILVRVPGSQPGGQAVLLVAHYDGVPAGPAAGDDAAGSAALLETLRALRAGPPLTHDVIFLFTDGEEAGLLGAAAFAREHPWAKDVGVILNFEARGVSGPSFMFETGTGNMDVTRVLADATDARATSLSTAIYRRLPNDTDLSELMILDRPAMNFAFIGGVERYHTSEDDLAHLDAGSVQHHGAQALALARAFGNGPLPRPVTTDAVFFFFPGLGTFVYPEWLAVPFAVAALVLLIAAFARGRAVARDHWTSSVALGFVAALVTTALGLLAGYGLGAGFLKVHLALGSGQPRLSDTYAAAVVMSVIALSMTTHRLAIWRRNDAAAEVGALLWWSLVGIVVGLYLPGGSFLFTWPLVAAAVAAFMSARGSPWAAGLHWIASAVVVAMVVPLAYSMVVVALGLDAIGGAILGLLAAMGATLLRPVLVKGTDGWGPLTAPALIAAGTMVMGVSSVRTSPAHPVGANRVFAIDTDSGRAFATGNATGAVGSAWVSSVTAGNTLPGSALPLWMQRLSGGRPALVAQPYASPLPSARVTVMKDSSTSSGHTIMVRIVPGSPCTLAIGVDLNGAEVTSASVDGRVVDRTRYRRSGARWTLDFVAPPDSGFTLGLAMPTGVAPPVLSVTSRVAGLVAWPVSVTTRPAGVVAIQNGDVSVVYSRTTLTMPVKRRR